MAYEDNITKSKFYRLIRVAGILAIFISQLILYKLIELDFIVPGWGIGAILLLLSGYAKRKKLNPQLQWWLLWSGRIMWIIPSIALCIFMSTFFCNYGIRALFLSISIAALGTFLTANGSIWFPVLCLSFPAYLCMFTGWRFLEWANYYMYVSCAIILVPAAFFLRNTRLHFSLVFRLAAFMVYGTLLYVSVWYLWPGMVHPVNVTKDSALSHITALEKIVLKTRYPRSFYSVYEGCDGETLYVTNLFQRPGIVSWNRNTGALNLHMDIRGASEQLLFECGSNRVYTTEFTSGKILVFNDTKLESEPEILPENIYLPVRIHKHPDSGLTFYNGDEETFPWYIVDAEGHILKKFEVGRIEELVPLADGSFITAFSGRAYHMKLDSASGEIKTIRQADLPDIGKSIFMRGVGPVFNHLRYIESQNAVIISDFATGKLYKLNTGEFEVEDFAHLSKGLRHLAFSEKHNLIASGNYLNGNIYILDASSGKVVYSRNIGSRLRGVTVSRDGERFYAVSRGGIFEITINNISGIK
ncbi:MAG TPA: hypothetical protein PLN69_04285 [bacterium]|nr:hypothetical protein [bacterium]